jgi:hypothetical protein
MKILFDKYTVKKNVGETDPNAKYFVLRVDKDPHARVALVAYIESVRPEEPEFASQLVEWLTAAEHPLHTDASPKQSENAEALSAKRR